MSEHRYGTGRLEHPDIRDFGHLMTNRLETEPAVSKIVYDVPPALNQGDTSKCVGFSWEQWLAAGPLSQTGPGPDAIYCGAQANDPWPGDCTNPQYEGSSVRGGAKWLQEQGFIGSYLWAFNVRDISAWMRAGKGPVVLGTTWYNNMFEPDRNGVVHVNPRSGGGGGHAYLAIGVDEETQMVECINSWGTGWGKDGHFWMKYADLDFLMNQRGEACTAVEVRKASDVFVPRRSRCWLCFWR